MSTNEPEDDCQNHCMVYVPQWQEKIGWKLFPNVYVETPEMDGMKDVMVCRTQAHLSFIDRIRTLISGKVEITTKTVTQNVIGETVTACGVSVRPPSWLDRIERESKRETL